MSNPTVRPPCPNATCPQPSVIHNGSHRGRARYHCRGCGRYFGATEGTPMYHLHTPPAEVAQALLVVMRRGSLRAAEEITGHAYETISMWLQRAAGHAEAVTTLLADDLHLTTVEIDEFWSFVRKKTGTPMNPMPVSGGDASCKTVPVGSLPPVPPDGSVTTWLSER